jgi:Leucine-rich repeat (LRR) protein
LPSLELHNLEILHLGYNKITNIKDLHLDNFPSLRALYLPGNDLSKVDGLQSCGELRELILDKNRIRSLDPHSLANLKKLQDLRIEENGLRSLSNFPVLPNLTILSVAGNRINDIIELEKLCRVCDAKEVRWVVRW